MIYDNKELGKLCNELNITPNQHFILYSIFRKDRSLEEYVIEYKAQNGFAPFAEFEVDDLVNKGYLINNNVFQLTEEGVDFAIYGSKLELNDNFVDRYFMDSHIAGDELFAAYPKFLNINGVQIPAKKGAEINGRYLDRDGMIKMYATYIGNNFELHNKVLQAIHKAKSMGQLNVSLREFILNKLWYDYFDIDDGSTHNLTVL